GEVLCTDRGAGAGAGLAHHQADAELLPRIAESSFCLAFGVVGRRAGIAAASDADCEHCAGTRLLKRRNSAWFPVRVEAGVHEPCEQRHPGDATGWTNESQADGDA